jgi:hypothetical protein
LPEHASALLGFLSTLSEATGGKILPARRGPIVEPAREGQVLVQGAQGAPEGRFDVVYLAVYQRFGAVGMSDPAAEMER